jgi:hypothetical protein
LYSVKVISCFSTEGSALLMIRNQSCTLIPAVLKNNFKIQV